MRTAGWRPYLIAAVLSIVFYLPFARLMPSNGDDGSLLTAALRVAEGEIPFRDFFEVMGPGSFYWLALFFELLGATWFASRVCFLVTATALAVILYYLSRRLLPRYAAVPVILFVAVSYKSTSHHMDSTVVALLSVVALTRWMTCGRPVYLFIAGMMAGLTSCFMLPKGAYLLASFFVYLCVLYRLRVQFWRPSAVLGAGYAVVVSVVVALFWSAGAATDLLSANVVWPLKNYSGVNSLPYGAHFRELYWHAFTTAFGAAFSPIVGIGAGALLSLPFLVVLLLPAILLCCIVWQRRRAFNPVVLPYWFAGSALWISELHRPDVFHLVYGSTLLTVVAFHLVSRDRKAWSTLAVQAVAISAFALAMLAPVSALTANHQVSTPRGVMYGHKPDAVLPWLNAHIKPGEAVFCYPYCPMYYFFSGGTNPTRYSILLYGYNTPSEFQQTVEALARTKVRYVLWNTGLPVEKWFLSYRRPRNRDLVIEPYLTTHYTEIAFLSPGYVVLELKQSSSANSEPPGSRPLRGARPGSLTMISSRR